MKLSDEQEAKVLADATEQVAARIFEKIEADIEETTCISISRFAGMLDLSTPQARRVAEDTIDFGPRDTRISLADAKRIVESRRVKKAKE